MITQQSGLGIGQTWQDLTGSRVANTLYTNLTGKPIEVCIQYGSTALSSTFTINGIAMGSFSYANTGQVGQGAVSFTVPNNATYQCSAFTKWAELR